MKKRNEWWRSKTASSWDILNGTYEKSPKPQVWILYFFCDRANAETDNVATAVEKIAVKTESSVYMLVTAPTEKDSAMVKIDKRTRLVGGVFRKSLLNKSAKRDARATPKESGSVHPLWIAQLANSGCVPKYAIDPAVKVSWDDRTPYTRPEVDNGDGEYTHGLMHHQMEVALVKYILPMKVLRVTMEDSEANKGVRIL